MTPTPSPRAISQALLGAALVGATGWLCFRSGGYFEEPRTGIAVAAWVAVGVVALADGPRALAGRSRAGWLAVAGLAGLAAWTALSLAWAPLAESAREDAVRVALYAAVLPLAIAAFRARAAARGLEPALVALVLVVVGYGLLGQVGILDLAASGGADGRLEQPLSYWNAMGALAALGAVLSARVAVDRTRPRLLRAGAAVALAPLLVGLVLTYSRGALAAAAVGLLALATMAPEGAALRARLTGAARRGAGARDGADAVAGSPRRPWATAATLIALAVVAVVLVAAGDRATAPADGASPERLSQLGSDRFDYWRVALDGFAADPLAGGGTASFRATWLREREVPGGAADAHSLYLETAAELGLVGIALLLAVLAGIVAAARRLLAGDRALAAGPSAALVALALHMALDWDWELPALTMLGLLLAGAVIARAGEPAGRPTTVGGRG